MSKILIVEDDNDIHNLLSKILEMNKHTIFDAYSGTEAKLLLEKNSYDLVLLDLMLPGLDGENIISYVREKNNTPIVVISAKLGMDAKITSLNLGADDYITKPFNNEEVIARVNAVLRRTKNYNNYQETATNLEYKKIKIDTNSMIVSVENNILDLTPIEYQLLITFVNNPKQVFTRNSLYKIVWSDNYVGTDNTIDVHISRLRNKIAKFDSETYIDTVRGIGFRLN